jgi:hypothetical protein
MRIAARTKICLLINFIGLVGIIIFVYTAADLTELFRFGPSNDLTIMSVQINTWGKYIGLVVIICIVKILEVGVNDIGGPNLGFSIYDPTETVVYGFGRMELQLLANGMWMVNSLGYVFKTMIIVSRIDVALISVVTGELASAATIYYLLNKKTQFIADFDTKTDYKAHCKGFEQCKNDQELTEVIVNDI